MAQTKRIVSFLLPFICIVLFIADSYYFVLSSSNNTIACTICPNISDQFEHSHSHGKLDYLPLNESKNKILNFPLKQDFVFSPNTDYTNSFITQIWQPPKNS